MSKTPRLKQLLVETIAKHLPPSASSLRLIDVNGAAGEVLSTLRQDLDIVVVPGQADQWSSHPMDANSMDAVVAYGYILNERFLESALDALRPGGRLVVVNSEGEVSASTGEKLESAGYTRILVETAVECPLPTGVLMRGEKPHETDDTLKRIQQVAQQDAEMLDLTAYKGRYIHLLVVQTPNKPAWTMQEGEEVSWQAAAVQINDHKVLLAFSSLPKAVEFMQPAVLAGTIRDVNKVAKFSKSVAEGWTLPVVLNPGQDIFTNAEVVFIAVDPDTAEAADE